MSGRLESILYRSLMVKENFCRDIKGGESHADMWGKRFLDRENQSRDAETGICWGYSGYTMEGSVAGAKWYREIVDEVREVVMEVEEWCKM